MVGAAHPPHHPITACDLLRCRSLSIRRDWPAPPPSTTEPPLRPGPERAAVGYREQTSPHWTKSVSPADLDHRRSCDPPPRCRQVLAESLAQAPISAATVAGDHAALVREIVAAAVGVPDRVQLGAVKPSTRPDSRSPSCSASIALPSARTGRLPRKNEPPNFSRGPRRAAARIEGVEIRDLGQVGRPAGLDHRATKAD